MSYNQQFTAEALYGPWDGDPAVLPMYDRGQQYSTSHGDATRPPFGPSEEVTTGYYGTNYSSMGGVSEALRVVSKAWREARPMAPVYGPLGTGYGGPSEERPSNAVSSQQVSSHESAYESMGSPGHPFPTTYYHAPTPGSSLESPAVSQEPMRYGDAAPIFRYEVGSRASEQAALQRRSDGGTSSTKHWCAICNRTFTRGGNLREHIRRHEDKREHRCKVPGCTWRFNTLGGLKSHLEHRHRVEARRRPVAANIPLSGYFIQGTGSWRQMGGV